MKPALQLAKLPHEAALPQPKSLADARGSVAQAFLPVFPSVPAVACFSKKKNTGKNACATAAVRPALPADYFTASSC
jgi:hypothetical protein